MERLPLLKLTCKLPADVAKYGFGLLYVENERETATKPKRITAFIYASIHLLAN